MLRRPGSGGLIALDTIITFPPGADSVALQADVLVRGGTERYDLFLRMIDDPAGDTVFASGPDPVTATIGKPVPVSPTLKYVGVGSLAKDVVWQVAPGQVFFGDTALFVAVARDSGGTPIPGTPIAYTSSDPLRARVPVDSVGKVVGQPLRGPVTISATLLTGQSVTSALAVQPVPAALGVFSGNAQTGSVGSTLAQPVVVRLKAADSLGVRGVVVTFSVSSGGGTLSQATDTTDVNGDASSVWTLGSLLGPQSLTVSAAGLTGITANIGATGVVGSARRLAFQVQPSNAAASVAIVPPVVALAQDTFGNTVAGFTGNVTIAIGTNPGSATLGGTTTVAAIAGIATFSTLTLSTQGTGYTLVASATGLTSGTSGTFNVTGGVPTQLAFTQGPTSANAGAAIVPPVLVEIRDVNGNLVAGATNAVTLSIASNPAGGTLGGTTTQNAVAGVATFANLSIDSAGTGYTLQAAAGGVGSVTSSAFDIGAGAAASLVFSTQPPSSAIYLTPFAFTVTARDAIGNTATSFTGTVTVAFGANPAGGTLAGTLSQTAVGGVATFTGVSIDNIGTGYTLSAGATGLSSGASGAFNIVAPANVNAWINGTGGNWGTAANWSRGAIPTATDTVVIRQTGTYTVNLDVNATLARLDVGASSGTQTLVVGANTLTFAGDAAFTTRGFLSLSGGQISGNGVVDVGGGFAWTGGTLNGSGGTLRVLSGGTLNIAPTSTNSFAGFTLELAGTGTWTGAQQLNTGQGAVLRVLPGGTLDIQGDPSVTFNLGGVVPAINVLGTLNRTTSTGVAGFGIPLNDSGTVSVQSGTLRPAGGGTSSGTFTVAGGATLDFDGGTSSLASGSSLGGAGTVLVSNGGASVGGSYAVTGTTQVTGGILNFDAAGSSTTALNLSGGSLGGTGLLTVSGPLSWTGGNFGAGGGTTRVLASGSFSFAPIATTSFSGYTLELAGNGTWSGVQQLNTGQGATLRVLGGATLDVQGNPSVTFNLGGAAPAINVLGALTRTTSVSAAAFGILFNDSGSVSVQSGTLLLANGGASDGAFTVGAGGVLAFGGGASTLAAASSITGAGTVLVANGTASLGGTYAVTGTTQIAGGTASFDAASSATTTLDIVGGTLAGSGLVTVSGALTWTTGNISGAGGTLRVSAGGTLNLVPATTTNFTGFTLELAGTGTWAGAQQLNTGQGAVLRVLSGATLDVQGDPSVVFNLGGAPPAINILGGLTRTASAGAASFGIAVNDSGTVSVQSGTLRLANGGASDGAFTVAAGTLEFGGGAIGLAAASSLTGAGAVLVSNGGVSVGGSYAITGTTQVTGGAVNFDAASSSTTALSLSGGSLGGAGLLTVSGPLSWTNGSFGAGGGTTRVLAGGSFSFAPSGTNNLSGYALELAGNGTWTGSQQLNTGQGALLRVLSGATLDIQGNPSVVFNLGGAPSAINVLGTLTRTTSAGAAALGIALNDTGSVSVQAGTLQLGAGGASSGGFSVATGSTLEFSGGSPTLSAASSLTGAGTVLVSSGSPTFGGIYAITGATQVVGGAATFDAAASSTTALTLAGGTLAGAGLVSVSGPLSWTSGNFGGGNGTTRVLAGGTFSFAPTAATSISAYTLDVAGSGTWTGAQQLNTGQGALLRVPSGATLDVQGDPNVVFNLGGALPTLVVQGTLRRSTSGNVATFGVPLNDSGTVDIQSGTLRFTAGSAVNFGGSVTGGGLLDLAGGTFTLTRNLLVAGPLQVGGGNLVFSGANRAVGVGGNFATASGGTLTMATATDSLNVAGSATFGGGASARTAGVVRVLGNFSQAGAATAFAPTGQRMRLEGPPPALQTVSFANPTTSFFDSLIVDRGTGGTRGTVQLLSDIRVNRSMTVRNSTDITGPTSRVTIAGGTLQAPQSTTSPTMTSLRAIELSATPAIGLSIVNVSPDTMIYNGAIAALPVSSGLVYRSVRVNTTGTLTSPGNVTYNGNLIVSSGTFSIGSGLDSIGGFLRTENTGAFAMVAIAASPTVAVRDSAVFGGGSSTNLTGGLLRIGGNFTQRGAANAFAASGTHRTTFTRAAAGTQTIQFQDPVNSFFRDLVLNRPITDTVRLLSDVRVSDSTTVTGRSVLASTGLEALRLPVTGVLRQPNSLAVIRASRVEFGTLFLDSAGVGGARISPDTAVFLNGGTITSSSPAFAWRSVRLAGGTLSSQGTTYNGNLILSAGAYSVPISGAIDSAVGFFRTEGTGIVRMLVGTVPPVLVVGDSAVFAGGSEAGQLTSGNLRIRGNFVQRGTGPEFQATAGHITTFAGASRQNITFATPGAAQSTFGHLFVGRTSGITALPTAVVLGSPVFVAGQLQDSSAGAADTIIGAGNTITANGFSMFNSVFSGAPVVVNGGLVILGTGVTFQNMNPAVNQLTLNRAASFLLTSLAFTTTPNAGAFMLVVNNLAAAGPITGTFVSSSPTGPIMQGPPPLYQRQGAPLAIISWNGQTLP